MPPHNVNAGYTMPPLLLLLSTTPTHSSAKSQAVANSLPVTRSLITLTFTPYNFDQGNNSLFLYNPDKSNA